METQVLYLKNFRVKKEIIDGNTNITVDNIGINESEVILVNNFDYQTFCEKDIHEFIKKWFIEIKIIKLWFVLNVNPSGNGRNGKWDIHRPFIINLFLFLWKNLFQTRLGIPQPIVHHYFQRNNHTSVDVNQGS